MYPNNNRENDYFSKDFPNQIQFNQGADFLRNLPPVKSDSIEDDPSKLDQLGPISSTDPLHNNPPQEKENPLQFPVHFENKNENNNITKLEKSQSISYQNQAPYLVMKEDDFKNYALSEQKFIIRTEECKFNEIYQRNKKGIDMIAKKLGLDESKEIQNFLDECTLLSFENQLINSNEISLSNMDPLMKIQICFKECKHIELMDFNSFYHTLHSSLEGKIVGKCLVCKSERELSSLYVDKRIYNLISTLKINDRSKFVIFPSSEIYSETLSTEDIYNSEDVTMKTILKKLKQQFKFRIYEVEYLTLLNHFSLGILLSSRQDPSLKFDKTREMHCSLITIDRKSVV